MPRLDVPIALSVTYAAVSLEDLRSVASADFKVRQTPQWEVFRDDLHNPAAGVDDAFTVAAPLGREASDAAAAYDERRCREVEPQ